MVDDAESGVGSMAKITPDEVITACRARYNNMVTKKLWDKVDPCDAQLLAMATELKQLKSEQASATAAALASASNTVPPKDPTNSSGRVFNDKFVDGVPRWRTVKEGDTKVVDGRTYHWCPYHKHSKGHWDGLYCTHHPSRCFRNKDRTNPKTPSEDKPPLPSAKLELHSKLKEVMCTQLCLSSDDVDRIFDQAGAPSN